MATIRVAQAMEWSESLTSLLRSIGHEVTADGAADLAFVGAQQAHSNGAACIIVAALDQVQEALDKAKAGEAYSFVRFPFVADEVILLVERVMDHVRLAQENLELRQQQLQGANAAMSPPGEAGNEDPITVARRLAGKPLADIEKQVILSTLEQFKGHRVRTATALGIGVRTLGMKLKRWREEGEPIVSRSTGNRSAVHAGT